MRKRKSLDSRVARYSLSVVIPRCHNGAYGGNTERLIEIAKPYDRLTKEIVILLSVVWNGERENASGNSSLENKTRRKKEDVS